MMPNGTGTLYTFRHRQEDLLQVLFRYTSQPDDSIEQSAILTEIRKEHPNVTESELYYRLEQLRWLGFITKERNPKSKSHTTASVLRIDAHG